MTEKINLCDRKGNRIGSVDKMKAHEKGLLHEAFSIFIFNSKNELLLQQRAKEKYHSGGLWSNTVCSHPKFGEDLSSAVQRRLKEEMGFLVQTHEVFSFLYRSDYANELSEHEFDHVFIGHYDENPILNKSEVMDYRWISISKLKKDAQKNPENYTTWLRKILENKEFEKICKEMQ